MLHEMKPLRQLRNLGNEFQMFHMFQTRNMRVSFLTSRKLPQNFVNNHMPTGDALYLVFVRERRFKVEETCLALAQRRLFCPPVRLLSPHRPSASATVCYPPA